IHIVVGGRGAVQAQQGHIRAGTVDQLGASRHGLIGGDVLVRGADRALPVEAENPVAHIAAQAVVGGQEEGRTVLCAVVEQGSGAYTASAHSDHGHRAYLVAPAVAYGADHVVVARAAITKPLGKAHDVTVRMG